LWRYLAKKTDKDTTGNWTKFLVNKKGKVVDRFEPDETPEKIVDQIKKEIGDP
jgi:glutathione peroxidase-family protein